MVVCDGTFGTTGGVRISPDREVRLQARTPLTMRLVFIGLVFSVLAGSLYWYLTRPDPFASPDVLVVGDSQISYGAGKVYLEFFDGLKSRCLKTADATAMPEKTGFLGRLAQSASAPAPCIPGLHAARVKRQLFAKLIKNGAVNAGVYGIGGEPARRYVQIGQGPNYQFCKAGQSPLETMLAPGHYQPKLLIMAFLGNAARPMGGGNRIGPVRCTTCDAGRSRRIFPVSL